MRQGFWYWDKEESCPMVSFNEQPVDIDVRISDVIEGGIHYGFTISYGRNQAFRVLCQ